MVNFSVLPPEINSGRMFFGAGSGSPSNGLVPESYGAVTYAYVIVAINNS